MPEATTAWRLRGFGLTPEQAVKIRMISARYDLNMLQIFDRLLAAFLPERFGLEWPEADRSRTGRALSVDRATLPSGNITPHALKMSDEQERVLGRLFERLGNEKGAFAALLEEAAACEAVHLFPAAFGPGEPWPSADRLTTLEEIDQGAD